MIVVYHATTSFISALDKSIDVDQLNNIFKLALMMGDVRLKEELEGVAGDIYVLDASVVSPSHLAKISPTAIKKFLICVQVRTPQIGRDDMCANTYSSKWQR